MAETHDTIDGLLAEFRGYAAGMPPSYHVTMSWHDFRVMLDRFEAAHKRDAVTDCNQFGDCAKLREALELIVNERGILDFCHNNLGSKKWEDWDKVYKTLRRWIDKAMSALSSPPRNCDRPECATTKAAQDVWRKEDGGKTAYCEWLLAIATEGGNDADE